MSEPNADPEDFKANSDSDENSIDSAGPDSGADQDSEPSPHDHTNASDSDSDNSLLLQRYELLEEIGSGAVGTVYAAHDSKLDRKVAIKVLHPDRLSNEHIARLHREAKIIGQMSHPSVVDVFDFDITAKNEPVMVMELLDGESLHEVLKRTSYLSIVESLRVFIQICDAMEHAHKRGLIHRDLKAGNIMLVGDQAKILDFGMAKVATKQDATITKVGRFVGTPSSISPEQASGQKVDHRTDIYSMGCLMYETLTGRSPFDSDNTVETILKQINEPAPALRGSGSGTSFPSDLEEIVARALKKKPSERFESMHEMKVALQEILDKYTGESTESTDKNAASGDGERSGSTENQEQELNFSNLEAVYGERKVDASSKPRASIMVPAAVISILAVVLIFIGFTMVGIETTKETPPAPPQQRKETSKFFVKSRKNKKTWYTLNDPITPEKLTALLKVKKLTHLNLANTAVNNTQLKTLVELPLDLLDLRHTKVNDESLRVLSKCKSLRGVLLDFCSGISPSGLAQLRKLPDLRVLSLAETDINDMHVEAISTIRTLRFLRLSRNPKITDAAAPHLASIPRLTSLAIGRTSIRKRGFHTLQSDLKLSYIGLKDHRLTDDEIVMLSDSLGLIDFNGNKIAGKTVEKLRKLRNIWFVDVRNCPSVTEKDSKALAIHLKQGEVWSDFNPGDRETIDCEWYFEPTSYDRSWLDSLLRIDIAEWQMHFAHPESGESFMSP